MGSFLRSILEVDLVGRDDEPDVLAARADQLDARQYHAVEARLIHDGTN
jgi:hypothetical protein